MGETTMDSKANTKMIARFVERYCSREKSAPSFEEIERAVPLNTWQIEQAVQDLVESDQIRMEWVKTGSSEIPVYRSVDFKYESREV